MAKALFLFIFIWVLLIAFVCCQRPKFVNIGAVFTYDSVIGRAAKPAIEAAVYDINRDTRILNGTEVRLFMKDAECNVFVGSVGGNLQIPFLDFGQLLQLRKFRLVDKIGVFRVKFICV